MKLMFISDIHGIKKNLDKIRKIFEEEKCDKLVVLGDLYYIGPRNKMKEEYDIEYVKNFLNSFKNNIICIRGNCDSEVDSIVSEFPIIDKIGLVSTNNLNLYLTHGHIYNKDNWPYENSILIYGHTHIPAIETIKNNLFINPGSISLPKGNYPESFMIFDGKNFTIYDVNKNIIFSKTIDN